MKRFPDTRNLAAELMAEAEKILPTLVEKNPNAVGILLSGGLSRGFADALSDVDFEIFFHRKQKRHWMSNQYTPQGNIVEFDMSCFEDWNDPRKDEMIWTMVNRWDKSHAKVMYDPAGKLEALLKKKLVFRPGELKWLKGLKRDAWWLIDDVATSWIQRGDLVAAHHSINRGIDLLLDYLYLKNREFIPYEKWKLFYASQLEILPADFERRVGEALVVNELSEECVQTRQAAMLPLLEEAYRLPNKKT